MKTKAKPQPPASPPRARDVEPPPAAPPRRRPLEEMSNDEHAVIVTAYGPCAVCGTALSGPVCGVDGHRAGEPL